MAARILRLSRAMDVDVAPGAWPPDDENALNEAVRALEAGELVAFPTETVYGLGARALDERALAKIFEAKGRPKAHPLIAHVLGEADARALAAEWTERCAVLARVFWPGPLTMVVPRGPNVPSAIAGGGDTIAVRAPAHAVARALIARLGEPIAAPSANRFQSVSPTLAEHVVKSLGDRVAIVLDGGPCDAGIESTVIDVRGERPRLLRPGALPIAALRSIEPTLEVAAESIADEDARRASPGMDARHYAPRATLVVVRGPDERARAIAAYAKAGPVGVVTTRRDLAADPRLDVHVLPADPVGYAYGLFSTLHALDDAGCVAILVEAVPASEEWAAVADRLRRGAAH